MSLKTKITLSDKELSLVTDRDWILTKQSIIQKVYELLGGCSEMIRNSIFRDYSFPAPVAASVPKIYKGENYLQLPYVLLDYPRCFDRENIFAIRTMFWWGNFFSITVHAAGVYRQLVDINLIKPNNSITENLFICTNDDEWQHHFKADNYIACNSLTAEALQDILMHHRFIKLAIKFDLDRWNEIEELLKGGYEKIAGLLVSFPVDEKVL